MAFELNCPAPAGLPSGAVTAIPYLLGEAQPAIALTEISPGWYSGHMTGAAGVYQLEFRVDGAFHTVGEIDWDGTAEVRVSTPAAIAEAVMRYTR